MGIEGSILYEKGRIVKTIACTKINPSILDDWKVVDTVGAGDAFMSGFCRMHTRQNWEEGDCISKMENC